MLGGTIGRRLALNINRYFVLKGRENSLSANLRTAEVIALKVKAKSASIVSTKVLTERAETAFTVGKREFLF